MKNPIIKSALSVLILAIFIVGLAACGGSDPGPSAKETATAALTSGAWKVQTVSVGGVDQTAVYKGLSLTFTATNFSTTNGGPVWPASGTWSFTDDAATTITRNDGLAISLQEVSATKLILKLTWSKSTIGPGRVASVGGVNTFTFGK